MLLEKESTKDRELIFEKMFELSSFLMGIVKIKENTIIHLSDNQATANFFQKANSEIHGKSAEEIGAEKKYIEIWKAAYLKALESKKSQTFEYNHKIREQSFWLKAHVNFLGMAEDKCPLFAYIAEDITEKMRSEAKLKEEEDRFREATENANAGLLDWNVSTGEVFFSAKWKLMLGYGNDDFLPEIDSWIDKIKEEDQEEILSSIRSCLDSSISFFRHEYRIKVKSGDFIWMLAQGSCMRDADGKLKRMIIWNSDIHQMKMTNSFLQLEKDKFETISNYLNSVIWISNIEKNSIEYVSKGYERIWKKPVDTLLQNPLSFVDPIHPEDRDRVIAAFSLQATGKYDVRYRLLIDNQITWIHDVAFPIKDSTGMVVKIVGIANDITRDIERENALTLEKEKIETIVNNIPIMLSFFNTNGEFEWCNKEWTQTLGWSSEAMKGRDILTEFYPEPLEKKRSLDFMLSGSSDWKEFQTKTKSGEIIDTLWANVRLTSGASIGIGKDIRKEKAQAKIIEEQQMQMIHSSRLSSLGEMAGGVAHEINNPLSIIIGKTFQLRRKLTDNDLNSEQIIEALSTIEKTAERIGKIVKGLKTFSRSGEGDPFFANSVQLLVQDALDLCSERIRQKEIDIILKVEPTIVMECRGVQIAQILLNLLGNSLDAIQGTPGAWIEVGASAKQDMIHIYVKDSGNGIPREISEKIMNPFFTTKELGKGTGLGLSISKSLAEDHGGTLSYDHSSQNTKFDLVLPIKQKDRS
jgi:PAS domain S-box-containing protein